MPEHFLWTLVAIDSLVFIFFASTFAPPRSNADWRSLGAFAAFVVVLFGEKFGFPLTLYLLAGPLRRALPGMNVFPFDPNHWFGMLLGWYGQPSFGLLRLLTSAMILAGFSLIALAWRTLYAAERLGELATTGVYAHVRHPQYLGFVLVMTGFLLQWPTLLTLAMYPLLAYRYVRLARSEDEELRARFGAVFERYAAQVPAFVPRISSRDRWSVQP